MGIHLKEIRRLIWRRLATSIMAVAVSFFFLSSVAVYAAEPTAAEPQKAEAPKAPAAAPPEVIPVAEIATRAMDVTNLLSAITAKFASSAEIETIKKSLPEISSNMDREAVRTVSILQQQPSLATLQEQQQLWQQFQQQTTGWLNVLTQQATRIQDELDRLADLQKTWSSTRAAMQASKQPGPILQQISNTLAAIAAAQAPLQAQRTTVLDFQSRVAREVERCGNALAQINRVAQMAVEGILVRDSKPIWSAEHWSKELPTLAGRGSKMAEVFRMEALQYIRDPSRGLPMHAALFVALMLMFCAARRQVRKWKAANESVSPALEVFENPYAAALVAPLFIATSALSLVPSMVRVLCQILGIVPVILLLRPVITPLLLPALYMLAALHVFDALRQTLVIVPLIAQVILSMETLGAIGVAGWTLKNLQPRGEAAESTVLRTLRLAARLALFILPVALLAGITGFMRLAGLLTTGILAASGLALGLYVSVRLLSGIAALVLRVWPLRMLQMVKHYRNLLEKRIKRLFVWAAVAGFSARLLNDLGLLNPALSAVEAVLSARLERGSISISLGDVLAFVLAVWVSYLVSNFIRFVLREDVYPRTRIAPGISFAISSLLNYIIIALGFVVGIGLMGVNLTKVSVLAGALGVGIGFGLQSVVNNFVSGLILLFERPVQVGDTIEVGDLQGEIKHIGIRASTVRTWHGSDIIVPNAQFITEKVTNWTLSDQLRRIDLPLGVNYGAAPQQVIELLEGVARTNPRLLRDPPPQALFMGYGDSTINFELRAWTDQFKNWQQIRSELAMAVYDAVYAAGMSFSFPQRDVHIIQDVKTEKKE
jgi:potassium-dependent mechanosensitive channel